MKTYRKLKAFTAISLSIFFILFACMVTFRIIGNVPSEYNISLGEEYSLETKIPLSFPTNSESIKNILEINKLNSTTDEIFNKTSGFKLKPIEKGSANINFRLLGLIPYKTVKVNVVPKLEVIPGGESVGVKLNTNGVLIVGTSEITDDSGNSYDLAKSSRVEIGDTLIAINDNKINNASHVSKIVNENKGRELELTLEREGKQFTVTTTAIKSGQDKQYRLGLWVRDKTAGVGTLSFLHPESKKFGALGHAITDVDTGSILSVKNGQIIKSRVVSIEQGKRGEPGEIRGVFYETSNPLGEIEKNTEIGVYGELVSDSFDVNYKKALPIAYQHEIKQGPAYILTTLDDNKIEKFSIEITKINFQSNPEPKSMIIKITDRKLLEKTGGIVQGMSGSPIIQNGKVVGAVTHVLINDPTKGYGIFIEWMIEESGIK